MVIQTKRLTPEELPLPLLHLLARISKKTAPNIDVQWCDSRTVCIHHYLDVVAFLETSGRSAREFKVVCHLMQTRMYRIEEFIHDIDAEIKKTKAALQACDPDSILHKHITSILSEIDSRRSAVLEIVASNPKILTMNSLLIDFIDFLQARDYAFQLFIGDIARLIADPHFVLTLDRALQSSHNIILCTGHFHLGACQAYLKLMGAQEAQHAGAGERGIFTPLSPAEVREFLAYIKQVSSKPQNKIATCAFCKQLKEVQTCGRCKLANYCSKECQKASWKDHRKDCVEKK